MFTQSPNYLHANFFQNNAKCTYFHPKMYLRRQKMYLVNNVLENRIRAVPLLGEELIPSVLWPDKVYEKSPIGRFPQGEGSSRGFLGVGRVI